MSEQEVQIALTRFAQVEAALTKSRKGTGLGLPLTKEFVEIHGGRIEIESRKGTRKSTIRLIFPHSRGDAACQSPA